MSGIRSIAKGYDTQGGVRGVAVPAEYYDDLLGHVQILASALVHGLHGWWGGAHGRRDAIGGKRLKVPSWGLADAARGPQTGHAVGWGGGGERGGGGEGADAGHQVDEEQGAEEVCPHVEGLCGEGWVGEGPSGTEWDRVRGGTM